MFQRQTCRTPRLLGTMAFLAALAAGPVAAQDTATTVNVIEWHGALVRILDAEGRTVEKVAVETLPPLPVPVLEINDRGMARIETDRGEVWLAPTSVSLDHTADILSDCQRLERLRTAGANQKGYVSRGLSGCK